MATIRLAINQKSYSVDVDPQTSLLTVLRENLDLTGSKYGCGEGQCGACTVLIDGKAQRSCVTRVGSVGQKQITTIEGLAQGDQLHPVQEAFLEEGAMQCGYCTSGMIMSAVALLNEEPIPSESRDHRLHGRQHLPLWNLSADRQRDSEGREEQAALTQWRRRPANERETTRRYFGSVEPERYELAAAPAYRFDLDRRDFFKFLGAGLLVFSVLKTGVPAQESGGETAAARRIPSQGNRRLAAHWGERQSDGLHREGGSGAEHSHLSEPGCCRRTACPRRAESRW